MQVFKVLVIGDSGVGKSCLLQRYADNVFTNTHTPTIGLDFKTKTVNVDGGNDVQLQIWDTGGQERFRTMSASYYRGAQGFLVVYDVNNPRSFQNIRDVWLRVIYEYANVNVTCMLVGNKCDEMTSQRVDMKLAKAIGEQTMNAKDTDNIISGPLPCVEVSAKTNEGVNDVFEELTRLMIQNATELAPSESSVNVDNSTSSVDLTQDVPDDSSGCCS